jgi:hypothetical protein
MHPSGCESECYLSPTLIRLSAPSQRAYLHLALPLLLQSAARWLVRQHGGPDACLQQISVHIITLKVLFNSLQYAHNFQYIHWIK